MCGALATRFPAGSKWAQEKSSRSLMLTEWAVDSRRAPICSAIDMNRLLKTSSMTGSACVPAPPPGRAATRRASRCPWSVTSACQPSSTTVVALASVTIAGPVTTAPARIPSRCSSGTSRQAPPQYIGAVPGSGASSPASGGSGADHPVRQAASTDRDSTASGRSIRNEYLARCSASKARLMLSASARSTGWAVSVPS
jgi:hypothetical protein